MFDSIHAFRCIVFLLESVTYKLKNVTYASIQTINYHTLTCCKHLSRWRYSSKALNTITWLIKRFPTNLLLSHQLSRRLSLCSFVSQTHWPQHVATLSNGSPKRCSFVNKKKFDKGRNVNCYWSFSYKFPREYFILRDF